MRKMQTQRTSAHMDLVREFESTKRTVKPDAKGKINITVPFVALDQLCKEELDEEFDEALKTSPFATRLSRLGDKLRFDAETMKEFFRQTADDIVQHLKDIMKRDEAQGVSRFLMVGGFSESPMIQDVVRKAFPNMRIIIPDEAGLSVLKGAVIFGHQPDTIESRVMRVSYGVKISPEFDASKHREDKKITVNGKEYCQDVFSTFMKSGTSVPPDHQVLEVYTTIRPFQDKMPVTIFTSDDDDVEYVTDEGCRQLGVLDVTVPDPSADEHQLVVAFIFGDTELKVIAVEAQSKVPCTSTFDLI